jgi:hypothetical protein
MKVKFLEEQMLSKLTAKSLRQGVNSPKEPTSIQIVRLMSFSEDHHFSCDLLDDFLLELNLIKHINIKKWRYLRDLLFFFEPEDGITLVAFFFSHFIIW